ncbi:aminodeoxychorismate synthase component I [Rhodococcus rhodnii]|uniref:aminodeoxychorismate synthase n=2 Tax=Rhodococcus rhodnii TaxID=38312 RepID=R7WQY5_9NOCA|nr:aminodeoxychorismate synthase component I [Rhodococcus rhodnii]EOM76364.1 bifunctional anthranilate synthase component I [Rhodococcus rhodnii LMG 5362]TXG90386.1 aminodeoxychorismate synthase component I [Rhodococcus rhodnii]
MQSPDRTGARPAPASRRPVATLLVDNYDSFTYNLFTLLTEVNGAEPTVVRNDHPPEELDLARFDNIVVSPGPGDPTRPRDIGIGARLIRETTLPVLGVCLGHQAIATAYGGHVRLADRPMHGRVSSVGHDGAGLFAGIPQQFAAVRYHSLVVDDLPDHLRTTAWTTEGDRTVVMGIEHRDLPRWGVQFHPESISSGYGRELLANFRDLSILTNNRHTNSRRTSPRRTAPSPEPPVPAPAPRPPRAATPLTRSTAVDLDPAAVFDALFAGGTHAFWLDRVDAAPGSRVSILGDTSGPRAEFVTYDVADRVVRVERAGLPDERIHADLFDYLAGQIAARAVDPLPGLPFALGYVGWLGYELKALTGAAAPRHHAPTPDAGLVFADRVVLLDHDRGVATAACLSSGPDDADAHAWLDAVSARLAGLPTRTTEPPATPLAPASETGAVDHAGVRLLHDRPAYLAAIRAAQDAIRLGESYEVCLTNAAHVEGAPIEPLHTFTRLRALSPVPYSAYLRFGELSVLSSSPECFLRVGADGTVESKPIKGTRPRGRDAAADEALRDELTSTEKEIAENLMIVDLTRNDLSRVCVPSSVHVPALFRVETYSTVHQLVSTVRGRLADGVSTVDAIRAAFPGGSMTGAPKLRTMEIIDELEAGPRGIYSGSIGFLSLDGAADLSVVIRTLVVDGDDVSFGVGGAITALSDPDDEFAETIVKATSVVGALGEQLAARRDARS